MLRTKLFAWLSAATVAATLLAACGPAATPAATQAPQATSAAPATVAVATAAPQDEMALPEVDPAAVTGDIIAAGSSTVFPLAERMAEIFKEDGYTGNLTIDSVGTGGGFSRFCEAGESDIANASRPIKDTEKAACATIGRTPIEFRVGTDALAVVVSHDNDFLTDVSKADLAKIFSSDAVQWSDVNPAWPAEDILRFSPGTDSGTFDYFVEAVMTPANTDADAAEAKLLEAGNLQLSEDDNVLVQGVEGSPFAIGYFGYAYYEENASRLKVLSVDGVEPDAQTVDANTYPLARPLFIYSDAGIMAEKPQAAAFINYFLTYVNDEIADVGYFPASAAALEASRQAWLNAAGDSAQ
jgi:phosphate transport system substrate-binding protein